MLGTRNYSTGIVTQNFKPGIFEKRNARFFGSESKLRSNRKLERRSDSTRIKAVHASSIGPLFSGASNLAVGAFKYVKTNGKKMFDVNFWIVEDFRRLVKLVNELEPYISSLSDDELRGKTGEFKERLRRGETLDDIQAEAFAVVREAAKRSLGLRHFDVQIIGGGVLHAGAVAEMQTGEGKTLVSTLAAYLNALEEKGVHVITVNDYLALRDSQWMGRVHRFLGLSVGVIQENMSFEKKKAAYSCDITYANNTVLGFDYLRDNITQNRDNQILRWPHPFHYAIVDEIDSVIIDNGRLPLIISQESEGVLDPFKCKVVAFAAETLKKNNTFEALYRVNIPKRDVNLTSLGAEEAWKCLLDCGWPKSANESDIWDSGASAYLKNALYVEEMLQEGKDYFVLDGEIKLIDSVSGRLSERRWAGGIHQAVEAKENRIRLRKLDESSNPENDGVEVTAINFEAARITWKQLASLYGKVSGMTGTANSERKTFMESLGVSVVVVPPNKPKIRVDYEPMLYGEMDTKWKVVAQSTLELNKQGRPVLVGTSSVNDSENLSRYLSNFGIPHKILNARPENASNEASIIAQAGRVSAVTISTNMAGRGTDILLGGNPEMMAKEILMEEIRSHLSGAIQNGNTEKQTLNEVKFSPTTEGSIARTKVLWALGGIPIDDPKSLELFEDLLTLARNLTREEIQELFQELRSRERRGFSLLERKIASVGIQQKSMASELGTQLKSQILLTLALMLEECSALCEKEAEIVRAQGGLHVIGTEFQESRRLDDQLKGRAGRQGDPGSTEMVLSMEDRLFKEIDNYDFSAIAQGGLALPIVEQLQAMWSARIQQFTGGDQKYDEVMEAQRNHVYSLRQYVLEASDLQVDRLMEMFLQTQIHEIVEKHCPNDVDPSSWPLHEVLDEVDHVCGFEEDALTVSSITLKSWKEAIYSDRRGESSENSQLESNLGDEASWDFLKQREKLWNRSPKYSLHQQRLKDSILEMLLERQALIFGRADRNTKYETLRFCILSQLDMNWMYQMHRSQKLWEASQLMGFGETDVVEEFKIAVSTSFLAMMRQAVKSAVRLVLNAQVRDFPY